MPGFCSSTSPIRLFIVRTMVRAVRPGGRIILADDDYDVMRLWPEPPGLAPVWHAYQRTYDRHGNDPIVGRRLVQLLHQAGVRPRRNTWVFFGGCSGQPDFEGYVTNLAKIIEKAIDAIAETGTPRETVQARLGCSCHMASAAGRCAVAWHRLGGRGQGLMRRSQADRGASFQIPDLLTSRALRALASVACEVRKPRSLKTSVIYC